MPANIFSMQRSRYWEFPNGELLTKEKGSLEAAFPDTDVEWVEFQSGTDILTAMQSGSIDFATIGTPPAALGLAKGYPFKIFYPLLARRLQPLRWEMNCVCYLLDRVS